MKAHYENLEFSIAHRPRVTKRLHLELDAQGALVVVVPRHWSRAHIDATLLQNTRHVKRFLAKARQRLLPPLLYSQGEQHFFLGESYSLAIEKSAQRKPRITLSSQTLEIRTAQACAEATKSALEAWYRQQAQVVFTERLQVISRRAPWVANRVVPLKLRNMRRTWGNCSSKGAIKLNTHLIKTPLPIVDAVIAHELCHLEEMNHSRAFYSLLAELNPNWRQDRLMLRSQGHIYLRS